MENDTLRENIRRWVPWLVSTTILSGVGLGILTVVASYRGYKPDPPAFALMLLLLLFALGTMTALLFLTKENFKATVAGFTLMLSGPAALWFGGTLIIMGTPTIRDHLFQTFTLPDAVDKLETAILSIELNSGWIAYRDWKTKNSPEYDQQVVQKEGSVLSELLENAFTFPASLKEERPLLRSPHIGTAFFYFPSYVIKFQMISGHQPDGTDGAQIFFSSRSNTDNSPSKAFLIGATSDSNRLTGISKGITDATVQRDHYGWERVSGRDIRCLNIVKYTDGNSGLQDRILIDMKKFTYTDGQIDLAIRNYQWPVAAQIWRMKGSVGTTVHEIPLLFRRYDSGSVTSLLKHESPVSSELLTWFTAVDEYLARDESEEADVDEAKTTQSTKAFLRTIKSDIISSMQTLGYHLSDDSKFRDLLQPSIEPKGAAEFRAENATDVSVILVRPKPDVNAALIRSRT
jgi:hypothetical protein